MWVQRFFTLFVFGSSLALRFITAPDLLPQSWTPETPVVITAPILALPDHTDTKTILTLGAIRVQIPGYRTFPMGSILQFVGTGERRVIGGKTVELVMKDPAISVVAFPEQRRVPIVERVVIWLARGRGASVTALARMLPEPMAALAAGILLGVSGQLPHDFYQALVATGTVHVVAASGYNVMLVAASLIALGIRLWGRRLGTLAGIAGIWLYVGIAGGSASVVRAAVMGSLTLGASLFGRPSEAKWLLWLTIWIVGMWQPLMLVSIGFQLSVAATAGILYLTPYLTLDSRDRDGQPTGWVRWGQLLAQFWNEFGAPTAAATLMTMPLILWYFGSFSPWSIAINLLILPIISWTMLLTGLALVAAWTGSGLVMSVLGALAYVPLWYLVAVVEFGAKL